VNSSRLPALALGLAATALLVAAYSSYLSYQSWAQPQPVAAPTGIADLEAELAAARTRLSVVERRLATAERNLLLTARRDDDDESSDAVDSRDADPESDDGDEGSERGPEPETTPKFVEFEIAQPGLDIHQNDNGSLSVRNSNAALANQIVIVKAQGQDGRSYDLPITVPPVE
jgi:hypothetical protein